MKTINLTLRVSDEYKYMVIQPYGGITLFKNKPKIADDDGIKYWDWQDGEISLLEDGCITATFLEKNVNWQESLREI